MNPKATDLQSTSNHPKTKIAPREMVDLTDDTEEEGKVTILTDIIDLNDTIDMAVVNEKTPIADKLIAFLNKQLKSSLVCPLCDKPAGRGLILHFDGCKGDVKEVGYKPPVSFVRPNIAVPPRKKARI